MTVTLRKPDSEEYLKFAHEVQRRAKNDYNYSYASNEVRSSIFDFKIPFGNSDFKMSFITITRTLVFCSENIFFRQQRLDDVIMFAHVEVPGPVVFSCLPLHTPLELCVSADL